MTPKIAAEELRGTWSSSAFNREGSDFDAFLEAVIAEASEELQGRLGSTYDSTSLPTKTYVKKAEREICDEILWRERNKVKALNASAGGSGGSEFQTPAEAKAAEDARERAEAWIVKILGTAFTEEVVITGGGTATAAPGSWGIETCGGQ